MIKRIAVSFDKKQINGRTLLVI